MSDGSLLIDEGYETGGFPWEGASIQIDVEVDRVEVGQFLGLGDREIHLWKKVHGFEGHD
jgi:hypothetical protein